MSVFSYMFAYQTISFSLSFILFSGFNWAWIVWKLFLFLLPKQENHDLVFEAEKIFHQCISAFNQVHCCLWVILYRGWFMHYCFSTICYKIKAMLVSPLLASLFLNYLTKKPLENFFCSLQETQVLLKSKLNTCHVWRNSWLCSVTTGQQARSKLQSLSQQNWKVKSNA